MLEQGSGPVRFSPTADRLKLLIELARLLLSYSPIFVFLWRRISNLYASLSIKPARVCALRQGWSSCPRPPS